MSDYNTELIPEKGAEGVGLAVAKMLEEILKYREDINLAERCNEFYLLRKNKHWKNKNPKMKLVSANLLGSNHQKIVNMLTDNNPTFNAVQAGEMGEGSQEALSLIVKTTDSWYNETEQQHQLEESVHLGERDGTVGEFLSFNPDINFPDGDVETESLDILYYSLYPPRCRKVEKAHGFLRWYRMTVREARRKWPEQAGNISSDLSLLAQIGDERQEEQRQSSSIKQIILNTFTRWTSGSQSSGSEDDSDELFVVEAWVIDKSVKDGKPVYPGNIRRVKVCNAGDVVLSDDYNPSINSELEDDVLQKQYLYNRLPVSHTQSVTDPNSPMGLADFEQLKQLNVEVNKSLSQFTMFKDKTARPKIINPRDSGVTNEELDNRMGIINPTNHLVAQAIRFVESPKMPTDIMAAANMYKDFFNEVAGSFNDVMQGQKRGSEVIAAKAIAMLLEEASRMARGKIRNYSKMLRERGRMFLSLAQSFYTTPRYITFQKQGKDETQKITREDLQIPGKINVVSGSTLPVSNIQRREEALALYKMGSIDQEELLKKLDWDNYSDVVERMQRGPIGEYIEKIAMLDIPGEILQLLQRLVEMDEKEIEKAIKDGDLLPFTQLLQELAQGKPEEKPNPEMIKAQADIEIKAHKNQIDDKKVQIEEAKTQAEIQLITEKIQTEIVERDLKVQEGQIKVEGLRLDNENMKIQRAEAVARIRNDDKELKGRNDKDGKYDDREIRSNNQTIEV